MVTGPAIQSPLPHQGRALQLLDLPTTVEEGSVLLGDIFGVVSLHCRSMSRLYASPGGELQVRVQRKSPLQQCVRNDKTGESVAQIIVFGTSKRHLAGCVEYEDPRKTNDKYTASKDRAYTGERR